MDIYQLHGCGTALITPFQSDAALDEPALRRHVQFQLENGIDFLVPCGTTGESPVLRSDEHFRIVEIVLEEVRGRVPVLGGAGGNNTNRVCEGIEVMEKLGVDGILSVSPYYNKPSQEGLFQHYRALAESTRLPILLYNVPGRTGSNLIPDTLRRLAEIPNILGVKEASGNMAQIDEILQTMPPRFRVISGDDALTLPLLSLGAAGVISVTANVIPREMTSLVRAALAGNYDEARRMHRRLFPLIQALFIESNPIPVKAALAALGRCQLAYRLPLVPPQPETQVRLRQVLSSFELPLAKETEHVAGR